MIAQPLVRVLGPIRVPGPGGTGVEPPGALPKRLVAALVLAGRDGRSSTALIDELWPDAPPRNARGALQMLVSRTRAVAAGDVLESTATGYRLPASDLALAEAAASLPRPDRATLDEVLALWRGEPGTDLDDPALAEDLAARAARARSRLLRCRAALTAESEPQAALADLDELDDPLDGDLVLLRMRALRAAGRPGDALAAFADHRERLADELGADPDPALAALNTELLRGGEQAELVGVRAAATPLLGRDDDLRRLVADVPAHRLTSILGAGGLGKTRLAHEVAGRLAERFERIVFVELAGATDPGDVALVVGAGVGARVPQARRRLSDPLPPDLAVRTREALAARRTLLVLDNCEHVVDSAATMVAELLGTVPSLTVLTTSRVPLLLPGERVFALQPLDVPTDATRLFEERAAAARPDVRLDPAVVERICRTLDGVPLAIELAAARLRSMPLDELDRRLEDRFAVLVGGDRTAPERHRTLFAVIDWSWRLLAPDRQRSMRMLAVFPDGFTVDSASVLLDTDAADVVADLVDQSLLTFSEGPRGPARYRMLETVREFGLRALEAAGETATARRGLDRFALDFCRRVAVGLTGGRELAAGTAITAEEETLLAVLRAPGQGREPVVRAVFALLAEFWIYRGEFERVPEQLPAVLAAGGGPVADQQERDEALRAFTIAAALAALTRTQDLLRTLALLRRVRRTLPPDADGFWPTLSATLFLRWTGEQALGELERMTGSTDPMLATFATLLRSQLLENAGRLGEALVACDRAQRLATRHGLAWLRVVAMVSAAQLHSERGERRPGLELGIAAQEEIRALDARPDLSQLDWIVAVNQLALGQVAEAEIRFTRIATRTGRSRDAQDERCIGLAGLAEVAAARGDSAAAIRFWTEAAQAADRASVPWRVIVGAARVAGTARLSVPDDADVLRAYRQLRGRVRALARAPWEMGDVPVLTSGVLGLAAVLQRPGRTDAERALGAELVALAVPLGARLDFPVLEAVPGVAAAAPSGGDVPDRPGAIRHMAALIDSAAARL